MSPIIDAHCLPPPSFTPFRLRFSENTEGLVALCDEKAYSLLSLPYLPAQMPKYHSWFPGEKRPLTVP